MATCGGVEGGVSTQGGVVHSHGAEPQSAGEVTGRSRGRYGPLCCPNALSHTHSSPFVPRCVVATSAVHTASFVAHLPVWPPNRQVWPPPSILSTSRRVGAKRVRIRKCNSQSLPGGRWEGCHQRYGPRFGLGRSTGGRWTQVGSCRGWALSVRRMPVGSGRHTICKTTPSMFSAPLCGDPSRWRPLTTSPQEGANTPRTGGASKKGPPCCPGSRGWRSHVH